MDRQDYRHSVTLWALRDSIEATHHWYYSKDDDQEIKSAKSKLTRTKALLSSSVYMAKLNIDELVGFFTLTSHLSINQTKIH